MQKKNQKKNYEQIMNSILKIEITFLYVSKLRQPKNKTNPNKTNPNKTKNGH